MSALATFGNAALGIAYACVLAATALALWSRRANAARLRALRSGLVWTAAGLLAAYLLASYALQGTFFFASLGDFLVTFALGALVAAGLSHKEMGGWVAFPLGAALAALVAPIVSPPSQLATSPTEATGLYILQASLHGLGIGALVATAPSWYVRPDSSGWRIAERVSLSALGVGLGLSSAWAWLNQGLLWQSQPRLNLFAGGWLLLLAGMQASAAERPNLSRACKTAAIVLALFGIIGVGLYADGWAYLPFLAW